MASNSEMAIMLFPFYVFQHIYFPCLLLPHLLTVLKILPVILLLESHFDLTMEKPTHSDLLFARVRWKSVPYGRLRFANAPLRGAGMVKWEYIIPIKSIGYMLLILLVILYLFDFIVIFAFSWAARTSSPLQRMGGTTLTPPSLPLKRGGVVRSTFWHLGAFGAC